MKTLLFCSFCILISLFIIPSSTKAATQQKQVSVSATVDEYLSYLKEENSLKILTNYRGGYWLLSTSSNSFILTAAY